MAEKGDAKLVLVTGASGFVATHLCYQLLEKGYKVRGTVRDPNNEKKCKPILQLYPDAKYPIELVKADLQNKECWTDAVKGCDLVCHVASPFPVARPSNEDEIIRPAVDGTINVLEACAKSGTVKRVVLTSSIAAISNGLHPVPNYTYTERDWTDPNIAHPYEKSKTLAEKAAWDFMEKLPDNEKFDLVTVNPAVIYGPALPGSNCSSSLQVALMLLERKTFAVPKVSFPIIDVRDVAEAQIAALTSDKAVGNRHILFAGNMWFADIARMYAAEFGPQGYRIPTMSAPNFLIRMLSFIDSTAKSISDSLGLVAAYDTSQMKENLGIKPRPIDRTLIDMGYSLIEHGYVKKTSKYTGPKN